MSKWFEVSLKAESFVLVEVGDNENEEQAKQLAQRLCSEWRNITATDCEPVPKEELNSRKRWVDEVID